MSDEVTEELHSLFEWNPPALQISHDFEPVDNAGIEALASRSVFYDRHIAGSLRCSRVLHIPDLHKRVSQIPDEKLHILGGNIQEQPDMLISKGRRDAQEEEWAEPIKHRLALKMYYHTVVGMYCLAAASALALQPEIMLSRLRWTLQSQSDDLASYAASLCARHNRGALNDHPELKIDSPLLKEITQLGLAYTALATWEFADMTIDGTDSMLGVVVLATSKSDQSFPWKSGSNLPLSDLIAKYPHPKPSHGHDASVVEALVRDLPTKGPVDESNSELSPLERLDESLRRSGSSIDDVSHDVYLTTLVNPEIEETLEYAIELWSEARERGDVMWGPPGEGHEPSIKLIQKVRGLFM